MLPCPDNIHGRADVRQVRVADTETTGFEFAANSLVEFAYVSEDFGRWNHSLLKPRHRISFGAMGTHHITEEMVADAPDPDEWFDEHFVPEESYGLVFHNAGFDRDFLPPRLREIPTVCTWRCALHLWPDADSHSNQALRYELGLDLGDMPEDAGSLAHRALYDAWVTCALYDRIVRETGKSFDELVELSKQPILLKKLRFGKHANEPIEDVPKSYLRWILGQDFDEDVKHTARHYLE